MPLAAASIEHAVTHAAELLLGAGAILALAWGVFQHRIGLLRWPLLAVVLLTLGTGVALGAWTWHEKRNRDVRGSPTIEFVAKERPQKRPRKELREEPWPLYGYNVERTRAAPFKIRPPYGGLWSIRTVEAIEAPPIVAYGRVFVIDQRGAMYAVKARTGRIAWKRKFQNCAAASAAVHDGIVYQPLMQRIPCDQYSASSRGYIVGLDAKPAGPVGGSPPG